MSITYLAASPVLFAVQRPGRQKWLPRKQLFSTSQDRNGKQNSKMMHLCQCWQRSTCIIWQCWATAVPRWRLEFVALHVIKLAIIALFNEKIILMCNLASSCSHWGFRFCLNCSANGSRSIRELALSSMNRIHFFCCQNDIYLPLEPHCCCPKSWAKRMMTALWHFTRHSFKQSRESRSRQGSKFLRIIHQDFYFQTHNLVKWNGVFVLVLQSGVYRYILKCGKLINWTLALLFVGVCILKHVMVTLENPGLTLELCW